jgi:hypothetical protein
MSQFGIHGAKGQLSLVPIATPNSLASIHGALRGRVHLADDFDALPDEIAEAFGARWRHGPASSYVSIAARHA